MGKRVLLIIPSYLTKHLPAGTLVSVAIDVIEEKNVH
jgi:hypothetical protein